MTKNSIYTYLNLTRPLSGNSWLLLDPNHAVQEMYDLKVLTHIPGAQGLTSVACTHHSAPEVTLYDSVALHTV